MATNFETRRGFVQRLEVGRAGMVVVTLLHDDGSRGDYQMADLDADPERFNERLSKLGLLRDAETSGEPVELEYSREGEDAPRRIERVTRITRHSHWLAQRSEAVDALVADVQVSHENRPAAGEEKADTVDVTVLTSGFDVRMLRLDLQIPERRVAVQQLALIRAARSSGEPLRFYVESGTSRIVGVGTEASLQSFAADRQETCDGFVESLGLPPGSGLEEMAFARFTTAPAFAGPGNVVPLIPFTQKTLYLLVLKDSRLYGLFAAGLRDNLRMRLWIATLPSQDDATPGRPPEAGNPAAGTATSTPRAGLWRGLAQEDAVGVVLRAELLAPLAAAANPVWIKISRQSLDHGPDGCECTEGLPSSDLKPRGLRDLRLPYAATWSGWGCFNHGVYRFQLALPMPFEISVDGKPLCVHEAEEGGIQFAHACLHGEHEVVVKIEKWTCDSQFVLDVYRIR